MLASILNIENEQIISDCSASVVKSFENYVLPGRFGLNSSDRANLTQNHTTEIAKNSFDAHNHLTLCNPAAPIRRPAALKFPTSGVQRVNIDL